MKILTWKQSALLLAAQLATWYTAQIPCTCSLQGQSSGQRLGFLWLGLPFWLWCVCVCLLFKHSFLPPLPKKLKQPSTMTSVGYFSIVCYLEWSRTTSAHCPATERAFWQTLLIEHIEQSALSTSCFSAISICFDQGRSSYLLRSLAWLPD